MSKWRRILLKQRYDTYWRKFCEISLPVSLLLDLHVNPPSNVLLTNFSFECFQCYPLALSPAEKFGYTLFFLVVPWPFFIYEFFTSDYYPYLVKKGGQLVSEMSKCESFGSLLLCYLKAIFYCLSFVFCLLLWPVAVLFIKYYSDGKYYLARGVQRAERERHIEMSEVLFSTARGENCWTFFRLHLWSL